MYYQLQFPLITNITLDVEPFQISPYHLVPVMLICVFHGIYPSPKLNLVLIDPLQPPSLPPLISLPPLFPWEWTPRPHTCRPAVLVNGMLLAHLPLPTHSLEDGGWLGVHF